MFTPSLKLIAVTVQKLCAIKNRFSEKLMREVGPFSNPLTYDGQKLLHLPVSLYDGNHNLKALDKLLITLPLA